MLHTTSLNPMAHLICVAHTRLELADILVSLRKAGVENLMALGGDPPADPAAGPGELAYASELVELARAIGGFSVGVAAHPAGHPALARAPGATGTSWPPSSSWPTSAITQFFFEASGVPGRWWPTSRHAACTRPVLPGILPVTSLGTVGRLGGHGRRRRRSGCRPAARPPARRGGAEAVRARGRASWPPSSAPTCSTLGVPGLHFYTFNTSSATREIYAALGLGPARRRRLGRSRPIGAWRHPTPVASKPWQRKSPWAPTAPSTSPKSPIIPFIEGDGTGVDIWPAAKLVLDAAAAKHGKTVAWKEVLAGQKAFDETGNWLPDETVEAFREHLIGIKGPLTTPIGGGIRSLNVALRQILDLYVCLRPVRWFKGVPSPGAAPRAGRHGDLPREHRGRLRRATRCRRARPRRSSSSPTCATRCGWPIRDGSGIGIKPISEMGSKRLDPRRDHATPWSTAASRSPWCTRATSRSSPRAPS